MAGEPNNPTPPPGPESNPTPNQSPDPALTPDPAALTNKAEPAVDPAKPEGDPAAPAPLTFDTLAVPTNIEMPEQFSGKFTDILNDSAMSPTERGNALLNLYAEAAQFASEKGSNDFVQLQDTWRSEIASFHEKPASADPVLGGKTFEATQAQVGAVIERFGDDDVRAAFDLTGAGNNPAIYRFLVKIAGELGEAVPISGTPGPAGGESRAARMFPTANKG